jgi:hypothetical protein
VTLQISEEDGDIDNTTTTVLIVAEISDQIPPSVSSSIDRQNVDTTQPLNVTITCSDNDMGSGISQVRLYIDDTLVQTWTSAGHYICPAGTFSEGSHSFYTEVEDYAGNMDRDPLQGVKTFHVESTEFPWMWMILAFSLTTVFTSIIVLKRG